MPDKMKVLVADDDASTRGILSIALRKWNYEPVPVSNGIGALEIMLAADSPLIAIVDWNMPKLSGPEFCAELRKHPTQIQPYLLMLTVRNSKEDIVHGLESGANDYLLKPTDPGELLARLNVGRRMVELQTDLLRARDALEHEAVHDQLTGLLNRKGTLQALSREMARAAREKTPLSVGMLDIDLFKNINDTYGHMTGDDVLRGMGELLQKGLREYDILGRFGGEEFLIITPSPGNQNNLYERLRKDLEASKIRTRSGDLRLTTSIGVAEFKQDKSLDTLLMEADKALYAAKRAGRNRVMLAQDLPPESASQD